MALDIKIKLDTDRAFRADKSWLVGFLFCCRNSFTKLPTTSTVFDGTDYINCVWGRCRLHQLRFMHNNRTLRNNNKTWPLQRIGTSSGGKCSIRPSTIDRYQWKFNKSYSSSISDKGRVTCACSAHRWIITRSCVQGGKNPTYNIMGWAKEPRISILRFYWRVSAVDTETKWKKPGSCGSGKCDKYTPGKSGALCCCRI